MSALTWADLEEWAGARIVSRGTSYQKSGYVHNLAMTSSGDLLAWVKGSENYATTVSMEKGRLSSDCTCPYGGTCKHAVAVVLEYLDHLQKGSKLPRAEEDDERSLLLEDGSSVHDDDDDLYSEDEDYDYPDVDVSSAGADVRPALKKKTKKELEAMLSGIIKDHPELKKEMGFAPRPSGKKGCDALTRTVAKAIAATSGRPGWRNYWRHEGYTPDYGPVRKGLQRLLDEGCADDVVKLGEKLFTRGTEQIEQSDDEGETAEEIAQAMPVIFKALAKCSLSDVEKLERAVDFGLRDEYDLCRGLDEFLRRRFGKKAWSDLAERLLARLNNMKPEKEEGSFSRYYRRDNMSDEIIRALENAGRDEEALALCFREADATDSYERLVRKLRQAGRASDAEEWIRKGVKATQDKWPGVASALKDAFREIRQQKRDWLFVSALRAENFVEAPGLKTFKELQQACEKAKVWPAVRNASMAYLERGAIPGAAAGWPLPDTGFEKRTKVRRENPPHTDVLIDIAIDEKRVDDVWRWYEARKRAPRDWFGSHRDDQVAAAVATRYPERAIAIWKKTAEWHIARANVGAYSEAVGYLKKVRKALDGLGGSAEWSAYLAGLTEANKRKTRLVQMLNVLTGKPIIAK